MSGLQPNCKGWVLLEMMVALTIFVLTALVVLGAVGRGIASAERTRDRLKAVDLARSTLAKLEAGLGTPQNLSGPVPAWEAELESDVSFEANAATGFSETPPAPSLWEVEVDTMPSEFLGLTHVVVTAAKRASPESDRTVVSFALHQLVRIAPEEEDTIGDLNDFVVEVNPSISLPVPAGDGR